MERLDSSNQIEENDLVCMMCNKEMQCSNYVEGIGQLCARCHYTQIFYRAKDIRKKQDVNME